MLQVSTSTPSAQAPGAPLPDDPTLADDGRIAFTPLLMRSPMPAAQRSVPPQEWTAVRANLQRAANAIEQRSFEAGRLPQGPGIVAQLVLKCPQLLLVPMRSMAASYNVLRDVLQVQSCDRSSAAWIPYCCVIKQACHGYGSTPAAA